MQAIHRRPIRCLAGAALLAGLAACASVGPGDGQYLQILQGSEVVLETDTSGAGLLNCATTATQTMQVVPALQGRLRCSPAPTTSPLPYSYKARRIQDGAGQREPYLVRAKTAQLCSESMASDRSNDRLQVVEDHCR